jgi:hypothetical protein
MFFSTTIDVSGAGSEKCDLLFDRGWYHYRRFSRLEGSGFGLIETLIKVYLGGIRKTSKNLSQYGLCSGRIYNRAPTQYKCIALTLDSSSNGESW